MKIALIQLNAGADKSANIVKATGFVTKALVAGAQLVVLPEVFNFRGDTRNKKLVAAIAEQIPGPSLIPLIALAKKYQAHILAGSIFETAPGGKAYNTSALIGPQGKIVAKYRKIHLFDARLGDKIIKESDCFAAGKGLTKARLGKFTLGLSVCYDLRFPLLYGQYAARGVNVLTAPSCFTQKTGQAHWEVLLRARAIENLSYMIAPNQVGKGFNGVATYGHSMIVAPWGEIVAQASGDKEEIIYGHIDIDAVSQARAILPGIIRTKEH